MTSAAEGSWLERALQNNMDWYVAQAQSHHIAYTRTPQAWYTKQRVPPYHSNLVAGDIEPDLLITELGAAIPHPWSIKDAYQQFDLAPLGFHTLFDAAWFVREPRQPWQTEDLPGEIKVVANATELRRWIAAWGETPPNQTVFVPELLGNPDVEFIYLEQDGVIRGGCAANRSPAALGVTNRFGPDDVYDRCLAHFANRNLDLGLVGYGRQAEVTRLERHGFIALGALRIWLRD